MGNITLCYIIAMNHYLTKSYVVKLNAIIYIEIIVSYELLLHNTYIFIFSKNENKKKENVLVNRETQ